MQTADDWVMPGPRHWIGVLDYTPDDLAATFGWQWEDVVEDGWGPTRYLGISWDGHSRYLLIAFPLFPDEGVWVEASVDETPAIARADLVAELGIEASAFLALFEHKVGFRRVELEDATTIGTRKAPDVSSTTDVRLATELGFWTVELAGGCIAEIWADGYTEVNGRYYFGVLADVPPSAQTSLDIIGRTPSNPDRVIIGLASFLTTEVIAITGGGARPQPASS